MRTVIFFKGCPLRCRWCSNPESIAPHAEIMWQAAKCHGCMNCLQVCPHAAITVSAQKQPQFRRVRCVQCLQQPCVAACAAHAIESVGRVYSVVELCAKLQERALFFSNAAGGVTLSGGEPLMQVESARALVAGLQVLGIAVAIETCGYFVWEQVQDFIDNFTEFLYDIKCVDSALHQRYTGKNNVLILENLRHLATMARERIVVRVPVIPNFNDNQKAILSIVELVKSLGITKMDLLPYHALGRDKYAKLGLVYPLPEDARLDFGKITEFKEMAINSNIMINNE